MIVQRQGLQAYEFTVVGPMGPMLRAAFPGQRIVAVKPCTVIRLRVPAGREVDLVDLIGLFESAGVVVEDLYRSSEPDDGHTGAAE